MTAGDAGWQCWARPDRSVGARSTCCAASETTSRLVALTCGRNRGGVRAAGGGVAPGVRRAAPCPEADDRVALRARGAGRGGDPPGRGHRGERGGRRRGLDATLAALRAGKRVALANKESLVMAGDLVVQAACAGGGEIVPVDSEHSAVLQCVAGRDVGAGPADPHLLGRAVPRMAGGAGAARDGGGGAPASRPGGWGSKITVDSATLANKALEVIEAHYLFRLSVRRAGGGGAPAEHHPRLRGVLRRQRASRSWASRRWSCRFSTR